MTIRSKVLDKTTTEPWHSVSIVPGKNPCDQVLANPRRRVLSRDAPRLPLAACDHPESCQCKYQHYPDRRAEPRRRDDDGGGPPTGKVPTRERRRPGERRARD